MLWAWPMSRRSALSEGVDKGFLTSMMVSLPPEMIRPSAYSEFGGRKARELSHSWPWVTMVESKEGGFWEDRRQRRRVWSREAEMTTSGLGKRTSRT